MNACLALSFVHVKIMIVDFTQRNTTMNAQLGSILPLPGLYFKSHYATSGIFTQNEGFPLAWL